jgi:hypothetical protein
MKTEDTNLAILTPSPLFGSLLGTENLQNHIIFKFLVEFLLLAKFAELRKNNTG